MNEIFITFIHANVQAFIKQTKRCSTILITIKKIWLMLNFAALCATNIQTNQNHQFLFNKHSPNENFGYTIRSGLK
ncbi:hypothetical protein BOO23_05400 [Vibrio navarrensis]|nr:hypothetical protein [Vibrio navarrensis]